MKSFQFYNTQKNHWFCFQGLEYWHNLTSHAIITGKRRILESWLVERLIPVAKSKNLSYLCSGFIWFRIYCGSCTSYWSVNDFILGLVALCNLHSFPWEWLHDCWKSWTRAHKMRSKMLAFLPIADLNHWTITQKLFDLQKLLKSNSIVLCLLELMFSLPGKIPLEKKIY